MNRWPKLTIRVLALANFVLGAIGLFLQTDSVIRFTQRHQVPTTNPLEVKAYWTMAAVSFLFASVTLLSAFFLWRTDRRARQLCVWLFGSEIAYWIGAALLDVALVTSKSGQAHLYATSIARASGVGNMGTALQFVSLYPVWALILVFLAFRKINKPTMRTST